MRNKSQNLVTGRNFIGYNKEIQDYRNLFLGTNYKNVARAIISLPMSGSSSFIEKVFEKIPDNVFYVHKEMMLCKSFFSFWISILRDLEDFMEDNNIENEKIYSLLREVYEISEENFEQDFDFFTRKVERIFKNLSKLGKRTVLVMDQFEYVRINFEGKTEYFGFLRNLEYYPDYSFSIIVVSKMPLELVMKGVGQGSRFETIFLGGTTYFTGFNSSDCDLYMNRNDWNSLLNESQKNEILNYCGSVPSLLNIFTDEMKKIHKKNLEIDPEVIFRTRASDFISYYEKAAKFLKCYPNNDEEIDDKAYLTRLIPYVYGPITENVSEIDFNALKGTGLLKEKENQFYIISYYFTEYLRTKYNKDIKINDLIYNFEETINGIIISETENLIKLFKPLGNSINEIQKNILSKAGVTVHEDYYEKNRKNPMFKELPNFFEIMDLSQKTKFIQKNWTIFGKYFNEENTSQPSREVAYQLQVCNYVRTPVGHPNMSHTDGDKVKEANAICSQLLEVFKSTLNLRPDQRNDKDLINLANSLCSSDSSLIGTSAHGKIDFIKDGEYATVKTGEKVYQFFFSDFQEYDKTKIKKGVDVEYIITKDFDPNFQPPDYKNRNGKCKGVKLV